MRVPTRHRRRSGGNERLLVVAVAGAWLLGFCLADVLGSSRDVVFSVMFAVAPLIASSVLDWAATGGFAAAATGLAAASPVWDVQSTATQYAVRVADVAVIGVAAVVIAVVRERRERRVSEISAIATVSQRAVLPALPSRVGPVRVAARYRSSARQALVGGDLYDLVAVAGRVRVIVGDVRGKGLDGVANAARTIRSFRLLAGSGADLGAVAAALHEQLEPYLGPEDFVTALLLDVHPDGRLDVLGCGHPPPLLCTAGGVGPMSVAQAPPLGLAGPLAAESAVSRACWRPGDRLLLYTDGLTEARDARGAFLPVERVAPALGAGDVEAALDRVLDVVDAHVGPRGRRDDLALLLLEHRPAAAGPAGS